MKDETRVGVIWAAINISRNLNGHSAVCLIRIPICAHSDYVIAQLIDRKTHTYDQLLALGHVLEKQEYELKRSRGCAGLPSTNDARRKAVGLATGKPTETDEEVSKHGFDAPLAAYSRQLPQPLPGVWKRTTGRRHEALSYGRIYEHATWIDWILKLELNDETVLKFDSRMVPAARTGNAHVIHEVVTCG
jgi:hypothetical protein